MKLTDDLLMAYADGDLDAKTQAEVEEAIAADPQAARRVAEHRALRSQLRSTFDKVLDEPVPERLLAAARSAQDPRRSGSTESRSSPAGPRSPAAESRPPLERVVIPFRPKTRPPKRSLPYWGALAASFVLGALVWHFGAELVAPGPLTEHNGQLLAAGALDRTLTSQLAKDQSGQEAVQIGVSFRSKAGNLCRTFEVRQQYNLAGLACREGDRWNVTVLAKSETSTEPSTQLRPAGSALPASVLQTVEQTIEEGPLDAQGEAQAKMRQWQESPGK